MRQLSCSFRATRSSMAAPYSDLLPIWLPVLLLALLILFKIKKLMKVKKYQLPPDPPKLPLIGNMHQLLGELPHVSLWNLSKKYGPVMHLQLGAVPTLVLSSADAAREVLKTHDLECASRPTFTGSGRLSYNYLDMAFSPLGDYWREVRKLSVVNLLSAKKVESFDFVRKEEVAMMIDSVYDQSQLASGSPVNLSEKTLTLTANIISRIAFGHSFRGSEMDNSRFEEMIQEAMCMLESFCAADFFPRVGWIVDRLTGFHKRLERSYCDLDALYQGVIDQHKDPKRTTDQEDFVDILLKLIRDQKEVGDSVPLHLTEDHIKSILMNVFIGGVDNNAITVVWVMTELARSPRVMTKVQAEIRKCIGNKGRVCESDLEHLPYLKMVLKENFRLHPPGVLLVPRETVNHFKLNGYDIKPKTLLLVNEWAIGRDPNLWKNPEEFFPERFEDSPIDYKGNHYELLPFGAGRRICPGMQFGMSMVELALANLLYCFDWKLPNGMKEEDMNMEEMAGLAVRKKLPLKLVPLPYNYCNKA